MQEAFLDSTTAGGMRRIREYVLGWLERLDYGDRLNRHWPAAELGAVIWGRIARDFAAHWEGPVVTNAALAEVIATSMVEDYFAVHSRPRSSRYGVQGPLPDSGFRRCVLDFVHDLEEFAPEELPGRPEAAARIFWSEVREHPRRWGYSPERGPFVDDEERAREVVLETLHEYYAMRTELAERGGTPWG